MGDLGDFFTFRRRVLFLGLGLMEAGWVSVYAPLLVPPLQGVPLHTFILLLWAWILLNALLGHRLLFSTLDNRRLYAVLMAVPALTYILLARLLLFPRTPLLALHWLGPTLLRPLYLIHPGPELGLLLFVLLVWWRGLGVVQMPGSLASVALRFRGQILGLVLGIILLSTQHLGDPVPSVWAFFLGSLMSLALVRVEAVGDLAGKAGQTFDRAWVGITLGMTAFIVGVGGLLARVITLENAARAYPYVRPALQLLARVLFLLVAVIGFVIGRVVLYLIRLLFGETKIEINVSPLNVPQAPPPKRPSPVHWNTPWLKWLAAHAELVVGALILFLILAFIVVGVRREVKRLARVREEEASVGSMGEMAADVGQGMRSLWGRLRDAWHLLRHYGPGATFLAALSVHNIYVNLLRLSAQQGVTRREAETPYEHLQRLERAFPHLQGEMTAIVDAFVAAHYGDLAVDEDALDALRRAWERIKEGVEEEGD